MTIENLPCTLEPAQRHEIMSLAEVIRAIVKEEESIAKEVLSVRLRERYPGITDLRIMLGTNYALLSDWIARKEGKAEAYRLK